MSVADKTKLVKDEIAKVIAGQDVAVEQTLVAILANGHVLLEGVPGLAKTLLVRTLSRALDLGYSRIQLTPDLMPSDVVGTNIFDPKGGEFRLRKGPIFTSILLADEINRTPPKTQSALLEAMEERKVTIDGEAHPLPKPFVVFATQNPIDFEGTYPLPEAQLDRFMLKIVLDYPEPADEIEVLRRHQAGFRPHLLEQSGIQKVIGPGLLEELQREVGAVQVEEKIFSYIYEIVRVTRRSNDLVIGGSPRAGIALLNCGKAVAAIRGRDFVIPDDVKELALPVLRHRVILRPEAEVEGLSVDRVLKGMIEAQVVPR